MQLEKFEPRTRSKIAVGLALVIPLGTAMITPAFASGSGHDVSASIVVKAIDRNGHRRTLTAPATAMSIGSRAHGAEYQTDAHGVIPVPVGTGGGGATANDAHAGGARGRRPADTALCVPPVRPGPADPGGEGRGDGGNVRGLGRGSVGRQSLPSWFGWRARVGDSR